MDKIVFVGLLVLGLSLTALAQVRSQIQRVGLLLGDYDCSCTYYCPKFGIKAGYCFDTDYWGWGVPTRCCVPAFMDYDSPDTSLL